MKRTEEREQARFVRWTHRQDVRSVMPALAWLHHSPNGGLRSGFTGAQMTALGVKPGFPDLILPARSGPHPGLAIEFKSATGSTSPAQRGWIAHLEAQEWAVHVARSAQEARSIACQYLGIPEASAPLLEAA